MAKKIFAIALILSLTGCHWYRKNTETHYYRQTVTKHEYLPARVKEICNFNTTVPQIIASGKSRYSDEVIYYNRLFPSDIRHETVHHMAATVSLACTIEMWAYFCNRSMVLEDRLSSERAFNRR